MSTQPSDGVTTAGRSVHERWEELSPAEGAVGFDDPYARLSPRRLADLALLARMVWLLELGRP